MATSKVTYRASQKFLTFRDLKTFNYVVYMHRKKEITTSVSGENIFAKRKYCCRARKFRDYLVFRITKHVNFNISFAL